jgi:thiosulfate/3-mercaptopyruvate sulfurtransferase
MAYVNASALVETAWLDENLNDPAVRIVDATSFLPGVDRHPKAEFEACHIPGAVYFDIDDVADPDADMPHMVPSPELFADRVGKLGLGDGNRIVVYDANGGSSAACRVWWMFRLYGHEDVAVLNGGLPKWLAEGRATNDTPQIPEVRPFTARMNTTLLRTVEEMLATVDSRQDQIIDVRSAGRFAGVADEPRAGLRKGHMPGAINLPFNDLQDKANNFVMRSPEEIEAIFKEANVNLAKPAVASCGSGVTACVAAFAAYLIGKTDLAVYDGSWTEWGGRPDTPIVTD